VPRLTGRVVVVTADAPGTALALAEEGAAVVLVGTGAAAGELAAEIEQAGGQVAVFAGDLGAANDRVALAEMVDELFATGGA
jgi:NAD(P)-dependent dehydrogenase (short-subunit alcohol dehydrogenase family)